MKHEDEEKQKKDIHEGTGREILSMTTALKLESYLYVPL